MDVRKPAVLLVVLLALAGCSGDDSASDSGGSATTLQRESVAAAPAAVPGAQPADRPAAATSLGTPKRALVYTGTLSVTAQDVSDAAGRAVQTALTAGGYVGADARSTSGDTLRVTLTLRVPSAKFTATVDDLAALGKETARKLGTDDKQTASVDVDARIASQRASVNRVRALLSRANTIAEITTVERELTARESELAASEASRRAIGDQVSYSTITLTLTEPNAPVVEKKKERGLWAGLRNGWHAFVTSGTVLLMVLGWLAPFLVALAVVGVPVWWVWRRRRRGAPPAEPAAAEPTA